MTQTPLVGLKADQFRHPLDFQATQALKQFPGLDLMVRNLLGPLAEQFFYLNNIAASVLVGENQLPHLHNLPLDACKTLDLPHGAAARRSGRRFLFGAHWLRGRHDGFYPDYPGLCRR